MSNKSQTKFKQTEIGEIPEDWEIKRLDEVCVLQRGFDLPTHKRIYGSVPVYASNGITGWHNVPKVKAPGVVTGRSGKLGNSFYTAKDYWPLNTTLWVKDFKNSDPYFVYLLLSGLNFEDYNAGSSVPTLNRNHIHSLKIAVPIIKEQQQIASILSSLDDKIELNRKMNKTLEEIGKALFKRWFVDFEFPIDDSKLYKSSGGKMANSELGEIPEGWEVKKLEDILLDIQSGRRPKGGVDQYKKGIPSIGAENIVGLANYDYSKEKYIPEDFFNKLGQGILAHKDVLLYKDGAQIGRKTIYRNNFPHKKCCINEHVFILRTKNNLQNYLYFWLDQPEMTQEIINLNSNAAQPGINQEAVKSLKILVPDNITLNMFDSLIETALNKIYGNAKESYFLSQIRDSLLPRLMSGKLRVN